MDCRTGYDGVVGAEREVLTMTDREKMIRLISDIVVPYFAEQIADHLLANGVVFKPGRPIEELDLGIRAFNVLKRSGINTIDDLKEWDEKRLLRIRSMGRCLVDEVLGKLAKWEERAANDR